ncbi:MAG: hypothetical protein PHY08_00445 [Candidatus Cloacimonetes bacterium]|nr:hypothetical protein [Candidatus Cloacimonadota bacterium]
MKINKFFFIIFFLLTFSLLCGNDNKLNIGQKFYNWAISKFLIKETSTNEFEDNSKYFSYDYFSQYEGLIIKKIIIRKFKLFNNTIDSTDTLIKAHFFNTINYIHIDTQDFIIQNNLLFKIGDQIDPYYFAESERMLRRNNFINEAAIVVIPDSLNKSANVFVYTKDVWSIRIKGKYNNTTNIGNLELSDINFLGTGSKLFLNIKKKPSYHNNYKLDTEYNFEKLFDKFGQGAVYYYSDTDNIRYGIGVNQYFVQPWLRWLGGLNTTWVRYRTNMIQNDSLSYKIPIHYRQQDVWLANTFSNKGDSELPGVFNHFIFANRLIYTKYTKYPTEYKRYFKENMFYLTNFTFLRRSFYQDSYIFAFGKIEDIPIGIKLDFLAGTEIQKIKNRQYFGFNFLISKYNDYFGYNLYNFRIGSYHSTTGWENGIVDFQTISFSNLKHISKIKYRNYYSFRISQSLNPIKKEDLITINDYNGIRGFEADFYGAKRISISLENDAFLPFSLFDFKIAFITFADLALLSQKNQNILKQPIQQGYGFALRVKNEQLIFSTFQLTFAYYPKGTDYNISNYRFYTEYDTYYQFSKMNYTKPEILQW